MEINLKFNFMNLDTDSPYHRPRSARISEDMVSESPSAGNMHREWTLDASLVVPNWPSHSHWVASPVDSRLRHASEDKRDTRTTVHRHSPWKSFSPDEGAGHPWTVGCSGMRRWPNDPSGGSPTGAASVKWDVRKSSMKRWVVWAKNPFGLCKQL